MDVALIVITASMAAALALVVAGTVVMSVVDRFGLSAGRPAVEAACALLATGAGAILILSATASPPWVLTVPGGALVTAGLLAGVRWNAFRAVRRELVRESIGDPLDEVTPAWADGAIALLRENGFSEFQLVARNKSRLVLATRPRGPVRVVLQRRIRGLGGGRDDSPVVSLSSVTATAAAVVHTSNMPNPLIGLPRGLVQWMATDLEDVLALHTTTLDTLRRAGVILRTPTDLAAWGHADAEFTRAIVSDSGYESHIARGVGLCLRDAGARAGSGVVATDTRIGSFAGAVLGQREFEAPEPGRRIDAAELGAPAVPPSLGAGAVTWQAHPGTTRGSTDRA